MGESRRWRLFRLNVKGNSSHYQKLRPPVLADGSYDVSGVVAVIAAIGLGRLIAFPVAGPLSDRLGRRQPAHPLPHQRLRRGGGPPEHCRPRPARQGPERPAGDPGALHRLPAGLRAQYACRKAHHLRRQPLRGPAPSGPSAPSSSNAVRQGWTCAAARRRTKRC